jgi:hypothetical protein
LSEGPTVLVGVGPLVVAVGVVAGGVLPPLVVVVVGVLPEPFWHW